MLLICGALGSHGVVKRVAAITFKSEPPAVAGGQINLSLNQVESQGHAKHPTGCALPARRD
jgi:hypothetical protein